MAAVYRANCEMERTVAGVQEGCRRGDQEPQRHRDTSEPNVGEHGKQSEVSHMGDGGPKEVSYWKFLETVTLKRMGMPGEVFVFWRRLEWWNGW